MQLDRDQLAAVTTTEKNVLVIAGPGSGKTRCIIERAAHLIENCKTSPSELVLVTFTRHAAEEMRTRLQERIGNKAFGVTIGTFHGIALQLLHRFGEMIGFRTNSTIYGEFEEDFLLKDVGQEMGLHDGMKWKKIKKADIDATFAKYYQEGVEPDEDDPARDLFLCFVARCRENSSYTYGSLLTGLRLLLPQMHQYLQWKHIILDEAHDTDRLQWEILKMIQEYTKAALFVVTDLDQSIYQWRGAYPEYLLKHQGEFTLFKLENNYRSVPSIVEASNRIIAHNVDRIPKTMKATREDGASRVLVVPNVDSQWIVDLYTGDMPADPRETAILARTHRLLGKIDRLMEEAGIPHTYLGKTTALTNSEPFRRWHAFLKLAVNVYDNMSFLLIRDIIGLSREDYASIRLHAAEEGKSHFQVYESCFEDIGTGESLMGSLVWMNEHFPELSPESCAFIQKYLSDGHKDDIAAYLDWLALWDLQDEIKEDNQGIILSTIHGAKGLEWPVVILAGCNEGILPGRPNDPDEIEGERRLMYVGMTRARDQLVITVRPTTSTDAAGRIKQSPESRFVAEAMGGARDHEM